MVPHSEASATALLNLWLSRPQQTALFLDVDGTLLDIAESPDAVVVPPGLLDALTHLHRELGGALALISGRPVEELDRLFQPPNGARPATAPCAAPPRTCPPVCECS